MAEGLQPISSVLASHVGGGAMQRRLRLAGLSNETIAQKARQILEEESALIDMWCTDKDGHNVLDEAPSDWLLDMRYLTAMRILVERENAPQLTDEEGQFRQPSEAKAEPVQSWYEKDEDIDDDMEDIYFGK